MAQHYGREFREFTGPVVLTPHYSCKRKLSFNGRRTFPAVLTCHILLSDVSQLSCSAVTFIFSCHFQCPVSGYSANRLHCFLKVFLCGFRSSPGFRQSSEGTRATQEPPVLGGAPIRCRRSRQVRLTRTPGPPARWTGPACPWMIRCWPLRCKNDLSFAP